MHQFTLPYDSRQTQKNESESPFMENQKNGDAASLAEAAAKLTKKFTVIVKRIPNAIKGGNSSLVIVIVASLLIGGGAAQGINSLANSSQTTHIGILESVTFTNAPVDHKGDWLVDASFPRAGNEEYLHDVLGDASATCPDQNAECSATLKITDTGEKDHSTDIKRKISNELKKGKFLVVFTGRRIQHDSDYSNIWLVRLMPRQTPGSPPSPRATTKTTLPSDSRE